jgi:hypothetical protein
VIKWVVERELQAGTATFYSHKKAHNYKIKNIFYFLIKIGQKRAVFGLFFRKLPFYEENPQNGYLNSETANNTILLLTKKGNNCRITPLYR